MRGGDAQPVGRSSPPWLVRASSFVCEEKGVAILEFALIVPVLLLIYFGTVEITSVMRNVRKVDILSRTIGDTLSQRTMATADEVNDVFQVGPIVLAPFDGNGVQMTVSAVGVLGDAETGPLQVCSSVANGNAKPRSTGTATDLLVPAGYQTSGMRYVLAEVSISYTPMIGSALVKLVKGVGNTITLSASVPWPTRGGTTYGSNTYTEVILPGTTQKACDAPLL